MQILSQEYKELKLMSVYKVIEEREENVFFTIIENEQGQFSIITLNNNATLMFIGVFRNRNYTKSLPSAKEFIPVFLVGTKILQANAYLNANTHLFKEIVV